MGHRALRVAGETDFEAPCASASGAIARVSLSLLPASRWSSDRRSFTSCFSSMSEGFERSFTCFTKTVGHHSASIRAAPISSLESPTTMTLLILSALQLWSSKKVCSFHCKLLLDSLENSSRA